MLSRLLPHAQSPIGNTVRVLTFNLHGQEQRRVEGRTKSIDDLDAAKGRRVHVTQALRGGTPPGGITLSLSLPFKPPVVFPSSSRLSFPHLKMANDEYDVGASADPYFDLANFGFSFSSKVTLPRAPAASPPLRHFVSPGRTPPKSAINP